MNAPSWSCALNHMTTPGLGYRALIALAVGLGGVGIELRNDLAGRTLFDGDAPEAVSAAIKAAGLRLLALAEVKRFNAWTSETEAAALVLMETAVRSGAEAVSLIPVNDGSGCGNGERQANLRVALRALKPMLEDHGLIGLVEPLGFDICSLRLKEEAVEAIEALGAAGRFRLIHDTFHHVLASEQRLYPEHTGMVHISGVVDPKVGVGEMRDPHRVLVDAHDRLGNVEQIRALRAAGYDGPVSFEAFSPTVHGLGDPQSALAQSIALISSALTEEQR
jgi:2-keto-myo-inositol isomerase